MKDFVYILEEFSFYIFTLEKKTIDNIADCLKKLRHDIDIKLLHTNMKRDFYLDEFTILNLI